MAKSIQTKQIGITELRIGMYVSQLQVPWSATPFPLEGTLVESHEDIVKLSQYGNTLHIDETKSLRNTSKSLISNLSNQSATFKGLDESRKKSRSWRKFCTRKYRPQHPLSYEMKSAAGLYNRVEKLFGTLRRDPELTKLGSTREVESISKAIVESVLGHPDALIWLVKVKTSCGVIHDHTLRTAIWATLMGRSMGLLKSALYVLNEAILLSGVGKVALKKKYWRYSDSIEIDHRFAQWSSLALQSLAHSEIEPKVLNVLANMNERLDGSGFPNGKVGKAIPYLSQIAAIAETFDLSMNPPGKKCRRSAGQSLCRLFWCKDTLFDGDLIDELIQAVGLYPSGSHVVLSSGESGIVVEQTTDRRIRATVIITHDQNNVAKSTPHIAKLGFDKYRHVIIAKESDELGLTETQLSRVNNVMIKFHYGVFGGIGHRLRGTFS